MFVLFLKIPFLKTSMLNLSLVPTMDYFLQLFNNKEEHVWNWMIFLGKVLTNWTFNFWFLYLFTLIGFQSLQMTLFVSPGIVDTQLWALVHFLNEVIVFPKYCMLHFCTEYSRWHFCLCKWVFDWSLFFHLLQ